MDKGEDLKCQKRESDGYVANISNGLHFPIVVYVLDADVGRKVQYVWGQKNTQQQQQRQPGFLLGFG